jgi:biotin operon repressor
MTSRASQRERILELLSAARGNWVSLPQVQACAAQYNARVFELRRLGYRIENKIREADGVRRSWFRLQSPPPAVNNSQTKATSGAAANSFPEFGKLAKESYGVD